MCDKCGNYAIQNTGIKQETAAYLGFVIHKQFDIKLHDVYFRKTEFNLSFGVVQYMACLVGDDGKSFMEILLIKRLDGSDYNVVAIRLGESGKIFKNSTGAFSTQYISEFSINEELCNEISSVPVLESSIYGVPKNAVYH
ncbi:hypothetical protein I3271_07415 [Photobacterium leiognathi]|uniref:hypothetical protein n=1 Tax=Photobacterium leiognathi TaxID=553611 RepID=UPI001EDD0128|nr:hypothetical protein [Photobacterium leiognathi]MCG3884514.1 hypothetical protein [Photobacterium leiognathi]